LHADEVPRVTNALSNIARSQSQGTTKGKRAEAIPVARALVPYL
jgi:hypothetical protein